LLGSPWGSLYTVKRLLWAATASILARHFRSLDFLGLERNLILDTCNAGLRAAFIRVAVRSPRYTYRTD
jgi:hypothetical protein